MYSVTLLKYIAKHHFLCNISFNLVSEIVCLMTKQFLLHPEIPLTPTLLLLQKKLSFLAIISPLQNSHHFISIKLTSTNYFFQRAQICPYLYGQGLFRFIDSSHPYPPIYLTVNGQPTEEINRAYLLQVQQDQLLISTLISSLSIEVLALMIDLLNSKDIWLIIENALASHPTLGS